MTTRRDFCRFAALGVMASPSAAFAFPVPSGAVVLDNCDPALRGQAKYADNLSFFNADGTLRTRVTDLNVSEMVGDPHTLAVDLARGRVWVVEFGRPRILQFDFNGTLRRAVGVKAYAVAVEPATGNVWATVGAPSGRSDENVTEVFDGEGRSRGVFDGSGIDIAYDPFGKAVWHLGADLVKVAPDGKTLARTRLSRFGAQSVGVDPRTGAVWVARADADLPGGANQLLAFDNAGKRVRVVELGDDWPLRVAVDPRDGGVWVALNRKVLRRYSAAGEKQREIAVPAHSFDIERATGNLWVATAADVLKMTPAGEVIRKTPHKAPTTQAWVVAY